jgi:hypothetical protein
VVVSGKTSNWFSVLSILELFALTHKCKNIVWVFLIGIDIYILYICSFVFSTSLFPIVSALKFPQLPNHRTDV